MDVLEGLDLDKLFVDVNEDSGLDAGEQNHDSTADNICGWEDEDDHEHDDKGPYLIRNSIANITMCRNHGNVDPDNTRDHDTDSHYCFEKES